MGFFSDLAINLGGTAISAYVSSRQADKARKSIDRATDAAVAESDRRYQDIRQDTAEQRAINEWALNRAKGMAEGTIPVEDIPGYKFRLKEGNKAIKRMRAAGGTFLSGRTAKELMRYGQDYAASEWNNEWNRIAQLAGLGAPGVNATINAGGATGNTIANMLANQGVNRANIAGANNASLQGSFQNVMDAFNRSSLLNRLESNPELAKALGTVR